MNRISKKQRTVGVVLLFGAVTIVIGCARVQKTSFADFWPGEKLSKAAGKVADAVRPGKSEETTADAKSPAKKAEDAAKSSEKKTADAKQPAEKGSRIAGLFRRDEKTAATPRSTSVLANDPFLKPSQRVGFPSEKETKEEPMLANTLRPSTRGANPFTDVDRRPAATSVASKERRRSDIVQTESQVETPVEKENPFAVAERETAKPKAARTVVQETPQGEAPAFADTFNSQMERLREEMNESKQQVAAAAPDQEFESNVAAETETATAPPMPETRELPEFTKFARASRKAALQQEFAVERNEVKPVASTEVAAAPIMVAPEPPAEEPVAAPEVEMPVAQSATEADAEETVMPYIMPRRPVLRSTYPQPGVVTLKRDPAPVSCAPVKTPGTKVVEQRVATKRVEPRVAAKKSAEQVASAPAPVNSEFITSTKSVATRRKPAESQSAPVLATTTKPVERETATVAKTEQPAIFPPPQPILRTSKLETVHNPPSTSAPDASMIQSSKQIPSRSKIRRERGNSNTPVEPETLVSNDAVQQPGTASTTTDGVNRPFVITADGAVDTSNSSKAAMPALPAPPTETSTPVSEKTETQPTVETASFASSSPVALGSGTVPLAATPLEAVPLPAEPDVVVADATRRGSNWPPIVLGVAIVCVLMMVIHRRLRATL